LVRNANNYKPGNSIYTYEKTPVDGQFALDNSVEIKDASNTVGDKFHGHVRTWDKVKNSTFAPLTDDMKNALVMAGYVERVAKTKFNLTDVG